MLIELDQASINIIRESLQYSKQRVDDSPETPVELKKQKIGQIDRVLGLLWSKVADIKDQ